MTSGFARMLFLLFDGFYELGDLCFTTILRVFYEFPCLAMSSCYLHFQSPDQREPRHRLPLSSEAHRASGEFRFFEFRNAPFLFAGGESSNTDF